MNKQTVGQSSVEPWVTVGRPYGNEARTGARWERKEINPHMFTLHNTYLLARLTHEERLKQAETDRLRDLAKRYARLQRATSPAKNNGENVR